MVYREMIWAVEEVFKKLDDHIAQTMAKSGMKCAPLCNWCCRTANIASSPIEFIPLAAWLYENGWVDDFLILLEQNKNNSHCPLFVPEARKEGKGSCLHYSKRGLICRLFGFGYRLDRNGIAELVTCKVMKDGSPETIIKACQLGLDSPETIPLFGNYSMQLYSIDPELAIQQLPIAEAIRIAIEKLYFHYADSMFFSKVKM